MCLNTRYQDTIVLCVLNIVVSHVWQWPRAVNYVSFASSPVTEHSAHDIQSIFRESNARIPDVLKFVNKDLHSPVPPVFADANFLAMNHSYPYLKHTSWNIKSPMLVGGLFFHSVKLVGLDCHMALNDTKKKQSAKHGETSCKIKLQTLFKRISKANSHSDDVSICIQ